MAQDILTAFVYLFGAVLVVTCFHVAAALLQVIEDMPFVRKKLWSFFSRGLRA